MHFICHVQEFKIKLILLSKERLHFSFFGLILKITWNTDRDEPQLLPHQNMLINCEINFLNYRKSN